MSAKDDVVVVGAGPAGLTAAYELAKYGIKGKVLEGDNVVGGLARTVEREGYRFDIGAHRFFTKVPEIDRLWDEMLGESMVTCKRLTRILYDSKFYDYPLKAGNALRNMGLLQAAACLVSYAKARLQPIRNPVNFEEWVTNQFGAELFHMFFKSYTEKVWGCSCKEIGADWASQRIKGLNLGEAVRNALLGQKGKSNIKTLVDEFRYPSRGAGQLWEACAEKVQANGWEVRPRTRVNGIEREGQRVVAIGAQRHDGTTVELPAAQVFSSMPLRELLLCMNPPPPAPIIQAARSLAYRDFLLVVLVLDQPHLFPDHWIYVHDRRVRVGRIDNFGNWTPDMLPDPRTSCLAMEYFAFEGDDVWSREDEGLVKMAYGELGTLGLSCASLVNGWVLRVPKAYPVYDPGYKQRLDTIRQWLGGNVTNLSCIGRNGQHRYNNQDHSMATALIAARNVALGECRDPWEVNEDAEYHEIAKTERQAPLTPEPRLACKVGAT
jgi:protoporphyrinogen oxidase